MHQATTLEGHGTTARLPLHTAAVSNNAEGGFWDLPMYVALGHPPTVPYDTIIYSQYQYSRTRPYILRAFILSVKCFVL